MGCSNPREKIENKINFIKLKKFTIQMERVKALKLLSEMEGCNIDVDSLEEYLASKNVKQFKNMNMKYNEKDNGLPKENQTNSLILNPIKDHGLNENQNKYNNVLSNYNDNHNYIANQNINKKVNLYLYNDKERVKKMEKNKVISQNINNENININNNNINNIK